jgi:hypothetical protein
MRTHCLGTAAVRWIVLLADFSKAAYAKERVFFDRPARGLF